MNVHPPAFPEFPTSFFIRRGTFTSREKPNEFPEETSWRVYIYKDSHPLFFTRACSIVSRNVKKKWIVARKTSVHSLNSPLPRHHDHLSCQTKKERWPPLCTPQASCQARTLGHRYLSLSLDTEINFPPHTGWGGVATEPRGCGFKQDGCSPLISGRRSKTHTRCFSPAHAVLCQEMLKRNGL